MRSKLIFTGKTIENGKEKNFSFETKSLEKGFKRVSKMKGKKVFEVVLKTEKKQESLGTFIF
ncbi:MAG: hypothetical protein QXI58_00655 [Candidatus Micrarchaeia archaeon]